MLEYFLLALAVFSYSPTRADDVGFYVAPNSTVECANDLIKWCAGMKYPQEGAGMTMSAINLADARGYIRVLCVTDFEGTNCTKNGSPLFSCTKDNKFYYKGNQLSEGSDEGTDDEICNTATQAFNNLMVQGMAYDNETVQKALDEGMKSFFEQMAKMQEQIEAMNKKLSYLFGNNFPFWVGDSSSDSDSSSDNDFSRGSDSSSEEEYPIIRNQREQE